ncbi:MAG: hypothetical protein H6854_02715 [Rhodospirillales bacterium]|nr:hypothetical protein [Rhodospirillales bacterium]
MVTTAAGLPAKMLIHNLLATGTSISILFLFGSTGLWLFGAVFIFQALVLLPKSLLVIRTILGIGVRDQLLPVVRYNLPGVAMLAVLLLSQRIFADVIWVDNLVSQVVLGMAAFTILGVAFFRKDCRKWLSGIINQ